MARIRKGLQIGHNDCPNAGLDKSRAFMEGNLGFIFARGVGKQALARSKNRTNLRRRFGVAFRSDWYGSILLCIETRMVGPGASEIALHPATVALVERASVFIFSAVFQEVCTFHLAFNTNAFTWSSTGDVALISPAIFNVVASDSEEPIEDLVLTSVHE